MEGTQESVLDAIYGDNDLESETLEDNDEDVEMVDVDAGGGGDDGDKGLEGSAGSPHQKNPNPSAGKKKKKKKKKKKRGRNSCSIPNITDINWFVMDACKQLKEKKSYLVWQAIGSLGVSAVRDLVKEVDVIQSCGGQRTVDGSRFRSGGGILWNILKTRDPEAYKEIMTKGREFEKQIYQPKKKIKANTSEGAVSQNAYAPDETAGGEVLNSSEHMPEAQHAPEPPYSNKGRTSGHDRMRVPVSYDDLFTEGEIHE